MRLVSSDIGAYGFEANVTIRQGGTIAEDAAFVGDPIHYKHYRLIKIRRIAEDIINAWEGSLSFISLLKKLQDVSILPAPSNKADNQDRKDLLMMIIEEAYHKASAATQGRDSLDSLLGKRRSINVLASLAAKINASKPVNGYDLAKAILAAPGDGLVRDSAVTENRQDRYRRLCWRAVEALHYSYSTQ